jgi:3-hydroxyacyl-[acyl-carrier-protein] dehydratase
LNSETEQLLRTFRKKPISEGAVSLVSCSYTGSDIKKIIPHREPLILVDSITGIDLNNRIIQGTRFCSPDDPVFQGHFPGFPVYPGSLQLESAGQMGLCLSFFLANQTIKIPTTTQQIRVRATKVLGAQFLEAVAPGSTMELTSQRLQADSFFETYIGQVVVNRKICSIFIGEICLL